MILFIIHLIPTVKLVSIIVFNRSSVIFINATDFEVNVTYKTEVEKLNWVKKIACDFQWESGKNILYIK